MTLAFACTGNVATPCQTMKRGGNCRAPPVRPIAITQARPAPRVSPRLGIRRSLVNPRIEKYGSSEPWPAGIECPGGVNPKNLRCGHESANLDMAHVFHRLRQVECCLQADPSLGAAAESFVEANGHFRRVSACPLTISESCLRLTPRRLAANTKTLAARRWCWPLVSERNKLHVGGGFHGPAQ